MLETTGICIRIRSAARGVERCRIEEQIVQFSRRRRPLLAEHLGDVENLWRDREKTEPRRQEPSVVVRERCNTIGEVVGSYAAPRWIVDAVQYCGTSEADMERTARGFRSTAIAR